MRKLLFALVVCAIALIPSKESKAQNYTWGIGVRAGFHPALSVKNQLSKRNSIDYIAAFRDNGMQFTGIYEWKTPVINNNFHLYYGVGGSIGFWEEYKDNHYNGNNGFRLGIDGIIGLEFKIPQVPITLSLDYKPYVNLVGWGNDFSNGALSVRYVF